MLRQSEKEENQRNKREVGFGRTNGDGGDAPSGGVMRRPLNFWKLGPLGRVLWLAHQGFWLIWSHWRVLTSREAKGPMKE